MAERQGKYLAKVLNQVGKSGGGRADAAKALEFGDPFVYRHLGSMATIGRYKALVDLRKSKVIFIYIKNYLGVANSLLIMCVYQEGKGVSMAGFSSWFIWRSAYLTRVVSWRNRFYVAINWLTTFVFGRDISRI